MKQFSNNTNQNDTINTLDILKKLLSGDTINTDINDVQDRINCMTREEYLRKHKNEIWQNEKDGRWYTYVPDLEKSRLLKSRASREKLEDFIVEFYKKSNGSIINNLFSEWVTQKLEWGEIKPPTRDRYIQTFDRCFKEVKNKHIEDIEDVEDWIKKTIHKYNLTQKEYSNMRTLIYGIFKLAKKKGYISYRIKDTIEDITFSPNTFKKKTIPPEQQVYNVEELPAMLKYLNDNLDVVNLGLLLIFKTGIRIGELSTLRKEDFNHGGVYIKRTETKYRGEDGNFIYTVKDFPKTPAGYRHVLIPPQYLWIFKMVEDFTPNNTTGFIFTKNGKRLNTYQFRKRLRYICEAKIHLEVAKSPHKVRKTYGTMLLDSKEVPESFIIKQMGHNDIRTTKQHYMYNRGTDESNLEMLAAVEDL